MEPTAPDKDPLPSQPSSRSARRLLLTGLLAGSLAGCVVLPQTRQSYDAKCRAHTRQVTLEVAVIGRFQSCHGEECALMLASAGLVTAVSAVVSGSIALVGNVVYWIELQGRCQPQDPNGARLPR